MKRGISFLLVFLMCCSLLFPALRATAMAQDAPEGVFEQDMPFTDLPASDSWKYAGIAFCVNNGIMNGISATEFAPDAALTRAQLVTILYRVDGKRTVSFENVFPDVASGRYYSDAVIWAEKNGIVNGFKDGTFRPDAPVTREQLVTIFYRYTHYFGVEIAGDPELLCTFPDAGMVSSYAAQAFGWAVEKGIIHGVAAKDSTFLRPKDNATRAQVAKMLMRLLEVLGVPLPEEISEETGTVNLMSSVSANLIGQPDPISNEAADAVADFSLSLFRAARNEDENTVLSPLSVLYALALLQNGARGETLEELEAATGMSTRQLNEALRAIMGNLKEAYGSTDISIANSIWVKNGFDVKQPFLQNNADYLSAAAYRTPMDDTSVKEMNDWISEKTNGMIEDIIKELPPETVLTLINAIAFKGEWINTYGDAAPGIFHAADGTAQEVEMLRSIESIYLHDDKAEGFVKNFYSDRYAFAVILPNEEVGLEEYVQNLDGAALRKLLRGATNASVETAMPKFKAETTAKLPDPLEKLGIRAAFSPLHSDLGGISDTPLFVSDGIQRAVIDVNEDGVSAAAATVLIVEATSSLPEPIATVTVDRPYLYLIYDRKTNVPLFIGTNVSIAK